MPTAAELIDELHRHASGDAEAGLARFGIVTAGRPLGMSVGDIRAIARRAGHDQAVAEQLWRSGLYEGRLLACFVADPKQVTPALMDRWAADFDNWATCDTACFHLFDKTPHAFAKIRDWAPREEEFVRRAAFALLASVALHAKKLPDDPFLDCLPLIEQWAHDPRNFVKKGVSWALRGVGARSIPLHHAAIAIADRLAASTDRAERWVGKDALRDLRRPLVAKKLGL
jgi:3-methyladenine DNA glycosylase AlkD